MNYIKVEKPKLLEYPSQSPDLSIFENMWEDPGPQKHAVHTRWPRNISELEPFCKEEWVKKTRLDRSLAGYKKGF